ncbi:hypothetical protein GCM10009566_42800 [Streptomyces murinus]
MAYQPPPSVAGSSPVFSTWGTSYNAVVGVGDNTGDGRSDLVERDTAGNLYRNAGDGKGPFGASMSGTAVAMAAS